MLFCRPVKLRKHTDRKQIAHNDFLHCCVYLPFVENADQELKNVLFLARILLAF
jgi:hypothetical protein